ncbi:MAG TPA: potassium transporter Kup [Balneolales bacterium]|nr:potassium transporter Kup [Balneolales bacterium]
MADTPKEQVISEQPGGPEDAIGAPHRNPKGSKLFLISLTALGVVYGDIGTSPLYAIHECFRGEDPMHPTPANIIGILSLIFWALIIVISIKYLTYVMRADNRGEGGIFALMAQLDPWNDSKKRNRWLLIFLGVFGASLLYGDGMITPAISVLSAIEGLKVATPVFDPYVIPITIVILVLLFLFQKKGTAGIGSIFGPVMLVWFSVLAILGINGIIHHPEVLKAVIPYYAIDFFFRNGFDSIAVLGAVFLVVTGGETLYADMGHFGKKPIRLAWFTFVLPSLLLNYFGQGALLLQNPSLISQPFYHLAPSWALYPLVILSTMATVIASQAVISGAFSLTRQAVLLGQFPRLRIIQTSSEEIGQIYIPSINWVLMLAAIGLVLGFRSSSNLAAAYGVSVTTTMVITTTLAFIVTREKWNWPLLMSVLVTIGFLIVDLSFFGANMLKIPEGGWFPLLIGGSVYVIMATWKRGRTILGNRIRSLTKSLNFLLDKLSKEPPLRVPGTGVFMSTNPTGTPPMLLHHLKHNQVLHEQVILMSVVIQEIPHVAHKDRVKVDELNKGIYRLVAHLGYMDSPDVPKLLKMAELYDLKVDLDKVTYYVGHETLIPRADKEAGVKEGQPTMAKWRDELFAFMSRNAAQSISFFNIPTKQVVELGIQVEL